MIVKRDILIIREKTIDENFIYIPNNDKQNYHYFCRLKLLVETFDTANLNQPIKIEKKCSKFLG